MIIVFLDFLADSIGHFFNSNVIKAAPLSQTRKNFSIFPTNTSTLDENWQGVVWSRKIELYRFEVGGNLEAFLLAVNGNSGDFILGF